MAQTSRITLHRLSISVIYLAMALALAFTIISCKSEKE